IYAAYSNLSIELPDIVISVELDPPDSDARHVSTREQRSWQERFFAAWNQVVSSHDSQFPSADFSDEVVSLISAPSELKDDPKAATKHVRELVAKIVKTVAGDRKSTRLNSSHVSISYAVFCLKKKNTEIGVECYA